MAIPVLDAAALRSALLPPLTVVVVEVVVNIGEGQGDGPVVAASVVDVRVLLLINVAD